MKTLLYGLMLVSTVAFAEVNWGTPPLPPPPPPAPSMMGTTSPPPELNSLLVRPYSSQICKFVNDKGQVLYSNFLDVDKKVWKLKYCFG